MSGDAPAPQKSKDQSNNRSALRWAGFGVELVGVIGIFAAIGYWADQKLRHGWPWLMLIGCALAFTGMMYLLVKETAEWRK